MWFACLFFFKENISVDSIRSGSQIESFARSDKGQFNPIVEEKEERVAVKPEINCNMELSET